MDRNVLKGLLERVRGGECSVDEALEQLSILPIVDRGGIKWDTHREIRCGVPEAVYGEGKPLEMLEETVRMYLEAKRPLIVTRISEDTANHLSQVFEGLSAVIQGDSSIIYVPARVEPDRGVEPLVITAGSTDIPVAREAVVVLKTMGYVPREIVDIGVAGIHRLLERLEDIRRADVIIAVAGMDGVLPGIVAGLVRVPVIGVPVSNGYGSGAGGQAALTTMLNSCSGRLAVVNIDAGYTAGCIAVSILQKRKERTL